MSSGLDPILDADKVIEAGCPALWAALSPLGRRARQPANFLPLQTAEARGKPFNATIGQITDGRGKAVPLPSMAAALSGLPDDERSRAFLYSPVEGLADLRQAWRQWQRRGVGPDVPSSLPIVTCGTAQARSLALELFVAEGRAVAVGTGRSGDRDLLEQKLGAEIVDLESLPSNNEPAVALLSAPIPRQLLIEIAERRPLVVIVDGGDPLFWDLIGRHPNLVPVKVDGAAEVGFLTFPLEPESGIAVALESKVKMILRAEVGSPSAATQVLLLRALTAASPPTAPVRPLKRPGT